MIRLVVTGSKGRMGTRILELARKDKSFQIAAAVDINDSLDAVLTQADVVIDFTSAEATLPNLEIVARHKKAIVIGSTGHTEDQRKKIKAYAAQIPLVMAPNMSVGVNVMWKLIAEAARVLGQTSQVNVTEAHHIHKKDKPSGTAVEILNVLSKVLGIPADKIPVESIREGEIVGDHTTVFKTADESLEITHHAYSRDPFALGALRAAKWIVGKPNGFYTMANVLGVD